MKFTTETFNNIKVNGIQTTKFKTNRLQISFANKLSRKSAPVRALLPYILKAKTAKYQTRALLNEYLEELYATHLNVGVKKVGLSHIITFDISYIQKQYTIDNVDLTPKIMTLLNEILHNALLDEKTFLEEKRLMRDYFKDLYANKTRYSIVRLYEIMYDNELYQVPPLGTLEDLENVTYQDVIDEYHSMIHYDQKMINFVGDFDQLNLQELISQNLNLKSTLVPLTLIDQQPHLKKDVHLVKEKQRVNQAKLAIGYRINAYYNTPSYYVAIVLNMLLGGSAESLLFKDIRETKSLAYYIGSSYDAYKGSLIIYAGITEKNQELALSSINEVINQIKTSDFLDEYLNIAKKLIVNGLLASLDSNGSLLSRLTGLSMFDKTFNKQRLIDNVNGVTKEEIASLMNTLQKDTIYILGGVNNEEN
jgi:predicted Zn-dependent peptidase